MKMLSSVLVAIAVVISLTSHTSAQLRNVQRPGTGPVRVMSLDYAHPATVYAKPSQGRQGHCFKIPSFTYFNLTDNSYYYPKNNIFEELTERMGVLEQIAKDGVQALNPRAETKALFTAYPQDEQSSVGRGIQLAGPYEGCTGYQRLLRSFDSYGGHCWVVYPKHQAISFVVCGAPRCQGQRKYGQFGACAHEERTVGVWAWCETLPYGKRVTKVYLPVPISCKCQIYDC